MRLSFKTRLVLVLVLAAAYAVSESVRATEAISGRQVTVDQTVADDLVTAGRTIRVQGEIQGDLAAAGSTVTLAGPVSGYVMSAGRNVTVEGRIGNDLWAAGETVDVDGQVGNNAMVAGRTVHFRAGATVSQDASLAGNTVTSEGRIERNLKIGATTARIGGTVGGTVRAQAARVEVLPGAIIQGDLVVRAAQPPDISPQAQVLGRVQYEKLDQSATWLTWPMLWLYSFVALLILGLAFVSFAPDWALRVAAVMRQRLGGSIVTGLLTLVAIPLLAAVLLVTLVGIPLAVVLMAFYVAVLMLSAVFVSYRLGTWLFERAGRTGTRPWARMTLGAFIVSALVSLPFVGWILALTVVIVGAGAIALERLAVRSQVAGATA